MNRYTVIAREGLLPLLSAVLAAFMVWHFISLQASLVFWVLGVLVLFMFRDPEREIPSVPLAIISPADGRILSISTAHDPYLDRQSLQIIVQMHPYGVFTTRSPVEGKVLEPSCLPDNVKTPHGVWLQTDEGQNWQQETRG